jgi:hypothetical protein
MAFPTMPGGAQPGHGPGQTQVKPEQAKRPALAHDGTVAGPMAPPKGGFEYKGPMTGMAISNSARSFPPQAGGGAMQGQTMHVSRSNSLPHGKGDGGALYQALMGILGGGGR